MSVRYTEQEAASLSIGEVAALFGVKPDAVRNWDDKLVSFRTPGNQRRYRVSDNPEIAALLSPHPPDSGEAS